MERTSIGLTENVAGVLCYSLGWVSGLIFILLEPENKFVRFHAAQSMIVFSALAIVSFVLTLIPFIALLLIGIVSALGFIVWIVLMVKAHQGEMYKLPWAGDQAEKWLGQQN